jgi:2-isopropylmalate synthase
VALARGLCEDVEFSPEDAGRSDPEFLYLALAAAIQAGAGTLNIPDTVGYTTPAEFGALIAGIRANVPGADRVIISAHCHNDLGLATANTLAAVQNGARQVEVTVNGIGERAGNTSLEEVAMALFTRSQVYGVRTNIDTTQIARASRLVSAYTGIPVQPNKAIVGANAFAHEAGIHQDGMLKNPLTYEIMKPETIGLGDSKLVLGKHSGRHAFQARLKDLGYELEGADLNRVFERFKDLCDKKKVVSDPDIEAMVHDEIFQPVELWRLDHIQVSCGSGLRPTASVRLRGPDGVVREDAAIGTGPVDSVYKAINRIVQAPNVLTEFSIKAVTEGIDAVGEVTIRVEPTGELMDNGAGTFGEAGPGFALNPQTGYRPRRRTYSGHGADMDIIVASAKAYMSALNKMLAEYAEKFNAREIEPA